MKETHIYSDPASLSRPAWTQTLEQGCGSGLEAFNHKQPEKPSDPLNRDFYVKTKGFRR